MTTRLAHPAVRRVTARLAELGVDGRVRRLDDSARTAAAAAAQLGVGVAQIANSLVFSADGAPLLVMASGGHRVDTAKVAALVGAAGVDGPTRTSCGPTPGPRSVGWRPSGTPSRCARSSTPT